VVCRFGKLIRLKQASVPIELNILILSSMSKNNADTPLMPQHRAIKQKYPDAVLLYRVDDFYEIFGQDAMIASKVLDITLRKKN
jgi:hypothetical protein